MLTKEQAKTLVDKALSMSRFPECELRIDHLERAWARFALNGVTTSGITSEQWMMITSTRDGKSGSVTVGEFDDKSLREAVRHTEDLAQLALPSSEQVEPLGPQKYPELENFPESTASARNDVFIPQIRAVIEASEAKRLVAAGFFQRFTSAAAVANKQGNFGYGRTTDASLSTTVRTPDGSSSGWASQPAVRIEEIDGKAIGQAAIEKCLRWKNPKRLEPGKYTVVLEGAAAGDLLEWLPMGLQARMNDEGRGFLSRKGGGTRLGEKVFPDLITLRTDPFHKLYSGLPWSGAPVLDPGGGGGAVSANLGGGRRRSADRSGEALPANSVPWIEKGVVQNLNYGRYWAQQMHKAATPAPNRLVLDGQNKNLDEMISTVDRGLLVTHFFYIRVLNPQTLQLTGLTRDGLFLIENGKITSPVVNFRFNESPIRLLQHAVALGTPMRVSGDTFLGGSVVPPVVATDFTFSSISDAV